MEWRYLLRTLPLRRGPGGGRVRLSPALDGGRALGGLVDALERGDGLAQGAFRRRESSQPKLSNPQHVVAAPEQAEVFVILGVGGDQRLQQGNRRVIGPGQ